LIAQRRLSFVIENLREYHDAERWQDIVACVATGALIAQYGRLVDAPDQRLASIRARHEKMTRYFRAMALTASTADLMAMSLRFAAHYTRLAKVVPDDVSSERTVRPLSRSTELQHAGVGFISAPMEWSVQYTSDGADHEERTETPEEAIALACRLLDSGADVFGVGIAKPLVSIGRDEIARIHRTWVRASATRR
jgi:hypothetical protein